MAIVHSGDRDQVEEQRIVKDQEESDFDDVEDRYVISTTRYQSFEFVSSFSGRENYWIISFLSFFSFCLRAFCAYLFYFLFIIDSSASAAVPSTGPEQQEEVSSFL